MAKHFQVPLAFSPRTSDPASLEINPVPLDYSVQPVDMRQTRLDGRRVLAPEIDLSRYTCRAVVDWVDVEIRTERETQPRHVSDHLAPQMRRRPYVRGLNGETRYYTGDHFTVRIQEPLPAEVLAVERRVRDRWGLQAPARLGAMETSLDWYPVDASDQARWEMVAILQRHFLSPAVKFQERADHPRFVHRHPLEERSSKPNFVIRRPTHRDAQDEGRMRDWLGVKLADKPERDKALRLSGHVAPYIDSTFYHGRDGARVMIRIQNKVSDFRDPSKGTFESLAPGERRARIEATLDLIALKKLGVVTPEDLIGFDFVKLRKKLFCFWLPTIEGGAPREGGQATPAAVGRGALQLKVFAESGVYGLDAFEKAWMDRQAETRRKLKRTGVEIMERPRVRSRRSGSRLAYSDLNRRAEKALRRLGKAWSRSCAY